MTEIKAKGENLSTGMLTKNQLQLSQVHPAAMVNHKLAIAGRLGENLTVKEGREATRIASLNALTVV